MEEHSPGVLAVKIKKSGMLDPSRKLPTVTQITDQHTMALQSSGSTWALATFAVRFNFVKEKQLQLVESGRNSEVTAVVDCASQGNKGFRLFGVQIN